MAKNANKNKKTKQTGVKATSKSAKAPAVPDVDSDQSEVIDDAFIDMKVKTVTFSEFDLDKDGFAVGFCGKDFDDLKAKQLRTMCTQVNVTGVRNAKKNDMIDCLKMGFDNWAALEDNAKKNDDEAEKKPRKQPQCSFCLLNVLFSDQIKKQFAELGNPHDRETIDVGLAAFNKGFWENVTEECLNPKRHCKLDFLDNPHMKRESKNINPGKILNHDWKKL